ncbi:MAG: heavy metal-associated domain-containing protein [Bacteroidota bacterium]|nr:heavy metal-associated domain-containing protein [Bacteroidota bacterium]MDP4233236.1 heavy metal-associated domain-containing protein [Bacteroidota bacterium]MDP4242145.1 heavy metal-associated domain-containing protein [Bacteroidota bacterium]MDP4287794.1 heavy metal-associated domain-containing protein [Bacteroidota bacterium]
MHQSSAGRWILIASILLFCIFSFFVSAARATTPVNDTVVVTDTVHVLDMVCGSCENRIKTKLGRFEGVHSVEADHVAGNVIVSHLLSVTQKTIEQWISKIGYSTKKYSADKSAHKALPACCKKENQ